MSHVLDICVIIPTRNSMPYIREHIQALNEWVHRVGQVVVVDSESTDGTLECIRKQLKHANVMYLDHPPGLYQSWNAAIQVAESKYTYIATVNDHIPFETLARLYEEAETHEVDVVVSAPEIVSDSGKKMKQWPIHRFLESSAVAAPSVIAPLELLALNSIFLPGTLIGSSASNLYRTAALQQQPFPCDYGHAGDSAWAILSSLRFKWLVVPKVRSTFWYHKGQGAGGGRALRTRLSELAERQVAEVGTSVALSNSEEGCLTTLQEVLDFWMRGQQVTLKYDTYRRATIPWVFLPNAWKWRALKKRNKQEFKVRAYSLLRQLRDLYS